ARQMDKHFPLLPFRPMREIGHLDPQIILFTLRGRDRITAAVRVRPHGADSLALAGKRAPRGVDIAAFLPRRDVTVGPGVPKTMRVNRHLPEDPNGVALG